MKAHNLVFMILLLTFFTSQGLSSFRQDESYSSNQLLIKPKDDVSLEELLKRENITYVEIKRLHTIVPIVSKARKDLKLEKKDISDEDLFKIAYKEMNEVEKSTYRNYVVTFSKKTDIEKIILKLKSSKDIELVEKNLVVKIQKF